MSMEKFSRTHAMAERETPELVRTSLLDSSSASQWRMLYSPDESCRTLMPESSRRYSFAYPPRYSLDAHSLARSMDSVQ